MLNEIMTFRFAEEAVNSRLIERLRKLKVHHLIDRAGNIHYLDEELVESAIDTIRGELFSKWAILFCPPDQVPLYRKYMLKHAIRFFVEEMDGERCFLLDRDENPHQWNLESKLSRSKPARKLSNTSVKTHAST